MATGEQLIPTVAGVALVGGFFAKRALNAGVDSPGSLMGGSGGHSQVGKGSSRPKEETGNRFDLPGLKAPG